MKKWQEFFISQAKPNFTTSIIDDSQIQFKDTEILLQVFNEDGVFWFIVTGIEDKKTKESRLMSFDDMIETLIWAKVFISTETPMQTEPKRKRNLREVLKHFLID